MQLAQKEVKGMVNEDGDGKSGAALNKAFNGLRSQETLLVCVATDRAVANLVSYRTRPKMLILLPGEPCD